MKEPIEELFKKSLESHEMAYRPDAWAAMKTRLDAQSPIIAPRSNFRYYLAVAGVGVAAVTAYLVFSSDATSSETTTKKIAQQEVQNETTTTPNKQTKSSSDVSGQEEVTSGATTDSSIPSKSIKSATSSQTSSATPIVDNRTGSNSTNTSNPLNNATNTGNGGTSQNGVTPPAPVTPNRPDQLRIFAPEKMVVPQIPDLCSNEEHAITNQNKRSLLVHLAGEERYFEIPNGKTVNFTPKTAGAYRIGYNVDGTFHAESSFNVYAAPDADFAIDDLNKFEGGLPTTSVESTGDKGTYVWRAENITLKGEDADFHFYKKGKKTIELTVSDGQCSSTVEKTIDVENDYNLMAVNSFSPFGNDPQTSTFIPFALTVRDVNFKMTIIDSKDGGIVYETSDASMPWDGTDRRSGRRESDIQVYIWKVTILNPLPGEPGEYVGTINKL